jgi:methyl-accepting chemotaxis protein
MALAILSMLILKSLISSLYIRFVCFSFNNFDWQKNKAINEIASVTQNIAEDAERQASRMDNNTETVHKVSEFMRDIAVKIATVSKLSSDSKNTSKESAQILSKICALFQYSPYLYINFNF